MKDTVLILTGWLIVLAIAIPLIIGLVVGASMCSHDQRTPTPDPDPNPDPTPITPPDPNAEIRHEITSFLRGWALSWGIKDISRFMQHYSSDFNSRGMNYSQLRSYQKGIFSKSSHIYIKVYDIDWNKISPERVNVSFKQLLKLDDRSDKGIVNMEIVKESGGWKIVSETWRQY